MNIHRKLIFKMWNMIREGDAERKSKQTPTKGIEEINNLAYIDDGERMHLLDIYYPEGTKEKLPVIIDIHGGGWVYGDKELNKYFCLDIASRGFAVVNISYRLVPDATVFGQVQDIFAALHFIEENASKYPLDMNNVFLVGDSAGGHLASLTTAVNLSKEYSAVYDVKPVLFPIRAVGCICAVTNMDMFLKSPVPLLRQYGKMMFGKNLRDRRLYYTSFKNLVSVKNLPPFYLVSSKQDIYNFQSLHLDRVLTENNREHMFRYWGKIKERALPHVFNVTNPEFPQSKETNDEMTEFFRSYMVENKKEKTKVKTEK
ncbi:MAG: alpha/beta hydrolase [Ruminococcaceae bacterium]|jgi:acetyl esterase/lipase|nr:alpha/beta hydrolase [Oscillospiraceae bacterium]